MLIIKMTHDGKEGGKEPVEVQKKKINKSQRLRRNEGKQLKNLSSDGSKRESHST